MYEPGKAPYGRADRAANWLLRARMNLNAEVYTGTAQWGEAAEYATKVIGSGYDLCDNYKELFMADNGENPEARKEIIFPLRQDGIRTKSYGGSFSCQRHRIAGMPSWGTKLLGHVSVPVNLWWANSFKDPERAPLTESTDELIAAAKDSRALFYSGKGGGERQVTLETVTKFTDGFSVVKWTGLTSTGQNSSDPDVPDTDIPLFPSG